MGTRNLTCVADEKDEIKVAQYGQWDGYFSGQGETIINFVRNQYQLNNLKKALQLVYFVDNKYLEAFDERLNESNDIEARALFEMLFNRDIGGKILKNLVNMAGHYNFIGKPITGKIPLKNNFSFGVSSDGFGCEYAYVINFKKEVLEVYTDTWGIPKEKQKDGRFKGGMHLLRELTFTEIQKDYDNTSDIIDELEQAHAYVQSRCRECGENFAECSCSCVKDLPL